LKWNDAFKFDVCTKKSILVKTKMFNRQTVRLFQ